MKKKSFICLLVMILIFSMNVVLANAESGLVEVSWRITSAVLWVGYAVALGMVVYIGVKYITGAADTKANMKSAVVNYLIGALIVFSATTIAGVVIKIAGKDGGNSAGALASEIVDAANSAASFGSN